MYKNKLIFFRPLGIQWEHEDASSMLLEYLIDQNHIDIEKKDVRFVQSLIKGEIPNNVNDEKSEFIRE